MFGTKTAKKVTYGGNGNGSTTMAAVSQNIDDLQTTLEEERRIKSYFSSEGIDERLGKIAPLFQAFREEQTVQLASKAKTVPMRPQMYQWAVAASITLLLTAGWCVFENHNSTGSMDTQTPSQLPMASQQPVVESTQKSLAVAEKATPATAPIRKKTPSKRSKTTPQIDPETAQAMAEIKAALALVSSKLDKGRNEAVKGASFLDAMEKLPRRKAG